MDWSVEQHMGRFVVSGSTPPGVARSEEQDEAWEHAEIEEWEADADRERVEVMTRVAFPHRTHIERAHRRALASSVETTRAFVIDGQPRRFAFLASGEAWVAHGEHRDLGLRVRAHGVDPAAVAFAPVTELGSPVAPVTRSYPTPGGPVLNRADVTALIDRQGLGEHREAILAAIRPAYRLKRDPDAPHRIGGRPDLAPGEQWPYGANGRPYTFVAQFDASQLPPLNRAFSGPAWEHGGQLLRIFAELEEHDGHPTPAVALACAPGAPLTRADGPPVEDLLELTEVSVGAVPVLTARVAWYVFGDRAWSTTSYDKLGWELMGGGEAWDDPQLLGHASNLQGGDPIQTGWSSDRETALEDWATLFSLPSHPGMSFGDGGSLAIVIRLADLAAGRYDRMVTDTAIG